MTRVPRVAVLTVSDRSWLALREDRTGPRIAEWVRAQEWELLASEIVEDAAEKVAATLRRLADAEGADLIFTTGGTGLAPRDQVPEATLSVADRLVPGIPEWIRSDTGRANPYAFLSRGIAALRGQTLIVNLPGSPRAVEEYLERLARILPHALEQLRLRPEWEERDRHPSG